MTREARFEAEALPHLKRLYAAAYRMTSNAADAEDLVQETMLRAFRAFDGYTPGTNAKAWLYTILERVRTDAFRKAGRRPSTVELEDDGPPVAGSQNAGLQRLDLEQAFSALPENFRLAVFLRDVEELSYEEIATALHIPVGTVMSRIHRGRALLRTALQGSRP
ncbi:MAG TPA: sigma-70 family RNA polymerase sigma factor [Vicinamibacteria bacterium]|nr:sigma-70 family RNA polymerase sigma factor [Vicinamibacteria bacterium]